MKQGVCVALMVSGVAMAGVAPVGRAEPYPLPVAVASTVRVVTQPPLDKRLIGELLVETIAQIESAGNPRMVGLKGERGLMQIKERTWSEVTRRHFGKRIPFSRAFEPELNKRVGAAYLNDLQAFLHRHRCKWKADERSLLLACYNAGPERVRQAGFDIRRLSASTRDYVARGSALHEALLRDHNISPRAVRLAMDATRRSGGA
jgi:soluble lytic murein transglycosylase-like protein